MIRPAYLRSLSLSMRPAIAVVLLGLLCAIPAPAQETGRQRPSLHASLTRGYEAISRSPGEAIPIFESIVKEYPASVTPRRQLGSLYIGAGRTEEALRQFEAAERLSPSDTTKLQIAYLLAGASRYEDARAVFRRLGESPDRDIRERSSAAAATLTWMIRDSYPWWGRIGGDPYYDSRFNNSVFRFWLTAGRYLTPSKSVSAYAVGLFTRDTRSTGGAVPVIYSDPYSLVGGGVRLHPLPGAQVDIQGGAAFDIISRPGGSDVRGDFRALASYGWGLYPEPGAPERPAMRFRPFVEAMAMGGYYSRYRNTIGFAHAKGGLRVLEWSRAYGELYLRTDFVADGAREFYNNVLDGSVGLRIVPDFGLGLQVLAEYHRGEYWDTSLPTAPYGRWFSSGRLIVVLDQPFAF